MQNPFPSTMLYGADYNPEQWPESVWLEDMRLMKVAHINMVTINVFSWALLEPEPDEYTFEQARPHYGYAGGAWYHGRPGDGHCYTADVDEPHVS